jgi:hypothetical protein
MPRIKTKSELINELAFALMQQHDISAKKAHKRAVEYYELFPPKWVMPEPKDKIK